MERNGKKTKTLGLLYGNLSLGGIQRGASFQIPMFKAMGYRIVVLSVQPPADCEYSIPEIDVRVCIGAQTPDLRAQNVETAAREHKLDLVVHHAAYDAAMLSADIEGARRAGVPVVVFWHNVFSHFYLRKFRQLEARGLFDACRGAVTMITLTKTDEAFFRMLGIPALAIPYSDPDMMSSFVRRETPHRLLWMNRFIEQKRPIDAVRIFEKVLARHPDSQMYILGESKEAQYAADPRPYAAARPALAKAVHFEGFQKDVRPYLEKCGVGLITSRFEGYSHTIVEMKMASMPVVAYAMPYLDTLKPDSGAICVPQEDIDAAADAIIRLFDDPAEFRRQGEKARESYFDIVSTDQEAAYGRLFAAVESGAMDELREIEPMYAHSVAETFVEHADWALRLMDRTAREETDRAIREEWAHDRSYRLGRILTWPYRKLKRLLKNDSARGHDAAMRIML